MRACARKISEDMLSQNETSRHYIENNINVPNTKYNIVIFE